ncbi:MAG: methylmalonyl-CoA mutase family protein [Cyclobacteriaceae bacterium]
MSQALDFSPFEKHSKADWIEQVGQQLKGENPLEKLAWKYDPEIGVAPIYFQEDCEVRRRGGTPNRESNFWRNLLYLKPTSIDNALIEIEQLDKFCDGTLIDLSNVKKSELPELSKLFHLKRDVSFINAPDDILTYINELPFEDCFGNLGFNPLKEEATINEGYIDFILQTNSYHSAFNTDGTWYVENGASITQEVGATIGLLVEYIDQLSNAKIDLRKLVEHLEVTTSITQDFFHEIAKIRAYRILIAKILEEFSIQGEIRINVRTSGRYKSHLDPNNNLIRNTTEGMAAIIGGCDSLTILPFENSNLMSKRTALNTSNLLKDETHLYRVVDPSNGSYYLDSLTRSIAEAAWNFFQEIERQGGYIKSKKSGWIDQQINSNRARLEEQAGAKKISLIGVNKHRKEGVIEAIDDNDFRLAKPFEREEAS